MDESTAHHIMSRRTALRAGAIGVGALWVAPVVQVVGMNMAHAASDPPPSVRDPKPGKGNQGPKPGHGNQGPKPGKGNQGPKPGKGNQGG